MNSDSVRRGTGYRLLTHFRVCKRESSGIHHTAIYVTVVTYAAKGDAGRLGIRMALSHGDFINHTALGVC